LLHGGITESPAADLSGVAEAQALSPQAHALPAGWSQGASAPLKLFEAMGAVAGDKLYVFAGFINSRIDVTSRAEVYDPATNKWSALADAPIPQSHVGTASDGRTIYFAGGFRGDWKGQNTPESADFWMYDTQTETWTQGPSLPEARGAGGLVLIDRTLHFFGGLMPDGATDSDEHWALDLDNQGAGWVSKAHLPDARNHLGYAGVGGKVYAIGGQHVLDETQGVDATVNAYDPATDSWNTVAPLPQRRSHLHNSTFVYNDKIYCVGGTDFGGAASAQILTYDPAANQWTNVGRLPAGRAAGIAREVGDRLIFTTGTPTGVSPQSTTWSRALNSFAGGTDVGTADLTASITSTSAASVIAGDRGSATVRITNSGSDRFRSDANVTVFISTDATIDQADAGMVVKNVKLNLKTGRSKDVRLKFNYPEQAGGTYFLLTRIDPGDPALEASLANNVAAADSTIEVAPQTIDLTGTIDDPSSKGLAAGGGSSTRVTISNLGNVSFADAVTFTVAATSTADPAVQTPLTTVTKSLRLSPQKGKRIKIALPLPQDLASGSYVLTLQIDPDNAVTESNEANNLAQNTTPFAI
jgi:N-acetylneuraminic acid mutarotase